MVYFAFKPSSTGVVLSRLTPAITPPVPVTLDDLLQSGGVDQHRAALSHRHVMRRVEGYGCHHATCPHHLPVDLRAYRIATVLYDVILSRHVPEIRRVAERVRQHDRFHPAHLHPRELADIQRLRV